MDRITEFLNTHDNGILQHSEQWSRAKQKTIGGSEIARIMNLNSFGNMHDLFMSKTGATSFKSNIQMHWGNLFEDVICRYEEIISNTKVLGENAFIIGPDGFISYSPDGLALVDDKIVLYEFKCPYSRIPTARPPKYYVPQVKTGLEIIPICDHGVLLEGVFRRCEWRSMGLNPEYDTSLVPKSIGSMPLACGLIGFYLDDRHAGEMFAQQPTLTSKLRLLNELYAQEYAFGTADNLFASNDLGASGVKLFDALLDCYNSGIIQVWYSSIIIIDDDNECKTRANCELATYTYTCSAMNSVHLYTELPERKITNYGILPWKLFHMRRHVIERTPGFLDPWKQKIKEFINDVTNCRNEPEQFTRHASKYNVTEYTIID